MTQKNVKTLSPASVIFVGEAEFCQRRADVRRVAAGRRGGRTVTVTVMPGAPGEPQHSVSSAAGESEPPRDWQHEAQAGPGRTVGITAESVCHPARHRQLPARACHGDGQVHWFHCHGELDVT